MVRGFLNKVGGWRMAVYIDIMKLSIFIHFYVIRMISKEIGDSETALFIILLQINS